MHSNYEMPVACTMAMLRGAIDARPRVRRGIGSTLFPTGEVGDGFVE